MDLVRTQDPREAERLLRGGHRLRRLAHDMAAELSEPEAAAGSASLPAGFRLAGMEARTPSQIAEAAAPATPPEHVDHAVWLAVNREEYWVRLLDGEGPCGPLEPAASRLLLGPAGVIAGAVAVTAMAPSAWWRGGAWIPEIFVLPDFQNRGLGRLLLGHAMGAARRSGHPRMGLTVSAGNPARRLYERQGFRVFRSTWFIEAEATLSEAR